jgi:DNA-binding PadR family transcriptional regulator
MFRFLILGLLRDGSPRHGYALAKAYRLRSGGDVSTGNFYRELQRLVGDGLVRTANNPPGADPRRTPYATTEAGIAAFDAWVFDSADLGDGQREDEISARALFLAEANAAGRCAVLDAWQEQLWVRGKLLERARDCARAKGQQVLVLLLSRRLKYTAADLEFLRDLRSAHEAAPNPSPAREKLAPISTNRAAAEHSARPRPSRARR